MIAHNANVNLQDENGNTPLFIAVFNYLKDKENYSHYIVTLLAQGADANTKNKSGISPKELAGNIANADVKKFFTTKN